MDITAVKGGSGTPLAGKVFVLDPGHGGDDGDNTGPGGLKERMSTWTLPQVGENAGGSRGKGVLTTERHRGTAFGQDGHG